MEAPIDAARSFIHPGLGKRPLHACSCSKAIAAFADRDSIDAHCLIEARRTLERGLKLCERLGTLVV